MQFDKFDSGSRVVEVVVLSGVYDPGDIYLDIHFNNTVDKQLAKVIVEQLKAQGIKTGLQPCKHYSTGTETQRISWVPAKFTTKLFDYLRDHGYISNSDHASLGPLTRQVETMLVERSKLGSENDNATVSQSDVITSFVEPYLDSLFNNLSFAESMKLIGIALGKWDLNPSLGSHQSTWVHIIKMRERVDLSKKFNAQNLDDICMSLTMISAMCSGTCDLNKTFLQLGISLPTVAVVKKILTNYLIQEIAKKYPKDLFTGWTEHFDRLANNHFLFQKYKQEQLNSEIASFNQGNLRKPPALNK